MKNASKVLFIGMDAGDKDLLTQWAREGFLPTFRELFKNAAWGGTINPPGLYVGAVWPSFYTGLSPARHKRYCFDQLLPGSYEARPVKPEDLKLEPFWTELSREGRKVCVIDVPKSPAAREVNGIHIVDWGTHDPEEKGFLTYPRSLAGEIIQRFGPSAEKVKCDAFRSRPSEFIELRDSLLKRVRRKEKLSQFYLAQNSWDFFATVFSESHCAGHQCWHLQDPAHPKYSASLAQACGNPLQEVYQAIDAAIGSLIKAAGEQTTVIVLASHGMGPHYRGGHLLKKILARFEQLEDQREGLKSSEKGLLQKARNAWQKLPPEIRGRFFKRWRKKIQLADAGAKRCFQVPNNDVFSGIRVNVAGREPLGRIKPGQDYEAFCGRLIAELLSLTHTATQAPAIKHVYATADLYPGEDTSHLPDLLVEWDHEALIEEVTSPALGTLRQAYDGCRTGDHREGGLFFAYGPGIRPGPLEAPVSVMDFTPSFAELLNVELQQLDGKSFIDRIQHSPSRRLTRLTPEI